MSKDNTQLSTSAPAPVKDGKRKNVQPPESKERRVRYRGEDANAEPRKEDHIYGVESRARWPSNNIQELHRDSMAIDGTAAADGSTPGDASTSKDNDTIVPEEMTVADLKGALDAAGVEYTKDDRKPDLVAKYTAHLASQEGEEEEEEEEQE